MFAPFLKTTRKMLIFYGLSRLIQFRYKVLCEVGQGGKQHWKVKIASCLLILVQSVKRTKFDKEIELAEDEGGSSLGYLSCGEDKQRRIKSPVKYVRQVLNCNLGSHI